MKVSLRALAAKLRSPRNAPANAVQSVPAAPVMEVEADDDAVAYDAAFAEDLINKMTDRIELLNGQVSGLVKINHTLVAQMTQASATIAALRKQPKNRYWNQRAGK